jgi:hypothetical protein
VRSRPPSVKPATRPDPSGPPRADHLGNAGYGNKGVSPKRPDGSGVNGLTPGPCDSSAGYRRQAGACRKCDASLLSQRGLLKVDSVLGISSGVLQRYVKRVTVYSSNSTERNMGNASSADESREQSNVVLHPI